MGWIHTWYTRQVHSLLLQISCFFLTFRLLQCTMVAIDLLFRTYNYVDPRMGQWDSKHHSKIHHPRRQYPRYFSQIYDMQLQDIVNTSLSLLFFFFVWLTSRININMSKKDFLSLSLCLANFNLSGILIASWYSNLFRRFISIQNFPQTVDILNQRRRRRRTLKF